MPTWKWTWLILRECFNLKHLNHTSVIHADGTIQHIEKDS